MPSRLTDLLELASGGMGRVTLAVREAGDFERFYAVKRMHPQHAAEPEFRAMFLSEARLAGMLRHANVVSVLDVEDDADGLALIMEYVDGITLQQLTRELVQRGELLPLQLGLRIAIDVCRGLSAAHELRGADGAALGLVHRDVSPSNVLVGFDGVARLTDFGIAKAAGFGLGTRSGVLKGKLAYCAPEQLRFEPLDARTDLFAFGIVLFEMLAGRRLYRGEEGPRSILDDPPPDLSAERDGVPDELSALLFELLAKDRAHRPTGARLVERRLEAILADVVSDEGVTNLAEYLQPRFESLRRERDARLEIARAALRAGLSMASPRARDSATATPSLGVPARGSDSDAADTLSVLVESDGNDGTPVDPLRARSAERVAPAPDDRAASPEPMGPRRRRGRVAALATLIVAVALASIWTLRGVRRSSDPSEPPATPRVSAPIEARGDAPAREDGPPNAELAHDVSERGERPVGERQVETPAAPERTTERARPRRTESRRPARSGSRVGGGETLPW